MGDIEYKGMLSILKNMHIYMNWSAEVLTALSHLIRKDDAMYQFTLPDYSHPKGFLDALAIRYNTLYNKEPDHAAVGRLILKQLRDQKLKFCVDVENTNVPDVPLDINDDINMFLFDGDALRISSSEINIVIPIKEKKKKHNDMDVDEEESENDFESDGSVEEAESDESDDEDRFSEDEMS